MGGLGLYTGHNWENDMSAQTTSGQNAGQDIKIRSSGGGEFDCYLVTPKSDVAVPAIVLASAVHGVDADIRAMADEFAADGYIAAAPDLFWRTIPGPLSHDDERARERSQPRLERIRTGEADLVDTMTYLRALPQFNGRAAVMGFCYGGPYAIIAPKRLGYVAGISCHGTRMLDYISEIEGVHAPMCILWGEKDHAAPAEVLDAYRALAMRIENLDLHIFPDVLHGYMMPGAPSAFHRQSRDFSMARARAILDDLRGTRSPLRQAS
jgi:carboxymethylenebutenolidase